MRSDVGFARERNGGVEASSKFAEASALGKPGPTGRREAASLP
jgi:hypothetical protein